MARWTEVSRHFTPPAQFVGKVNGMADDGADRILYGFTTIELRNRSGKIKFIEAIGDQTKKSGD